MTGRGPTPPRPATRHLTERVRHVAAVAAVAAAALGPAGCRLGLEPQVAWLPPAAAGPPDGAGPSFVAEKRNELVAGIRPLRYVNEAGEAPDGVEPGELGRIFADRLRDARIFADVIYPVFDQPVDVYLEPTVRVEVEKNEGLNALAALTGTCWLNGVGLDYDHYVRFELYVRDPAHPFEIDDPTRERRRRVEQKSMTAERYPSALWLIGFPLSSVILAITESATTDRLLLERLGTRDFERAVADMVAWLGEEFAPETKRVSPDGPLGCPEHRTILGNTGKYCVVCGRLLWYPLLDRRADRPPDDGG